MGHITRFASKHAMLDKLNRLAATLIRYSCPQIYPCQNYGIFFITLSPLHLFIKYEAIASLSRNQHCLPTTWTGQNPSCKTYIGHRKYWHDALLNAQLSLSATDRMHDLIWYKAYLILLNSLNSTSHPPLSQINIFTDGSQTKHHTGAGFVIYRQGVIIAEGARRLPPLTTVFQAEITAIQMAAEALPHILLPTDRFVKIFTDSQAALHYATFVRKKMKPLPTS